MPTNPPAHPPRRLRGRVPWGAVALVAALVTFAAGIVHLFALRFDVGDVYSPYSTMRADPPGAKAFFESLAALPGLRVERSLRPLSALGTEVLRPAGYDNGEGTFTCLILGENARKWPFLLLPDSVERLEAIMRRGGRVVVTFEPTPDVPTLENLSAARARESDPASLPKHAGPTARRLAEKSVPPDLSERWGIDFRRHSDKLRTNRPENARDNAAPAGAPGTPVDADGFATPDPAVAMRGGPDAAFANGREAVAWHSVVAFRTETVLAHAARWHAVYDRHDRPVIVARPFGTAGGELILVGDSYFLSNEGLRNDPSPALLAALVGQGHRVIFDESHFDIREDPGLMTLARRYRLQGALAAIGLLVGLFVWRNVVSLVPQGAGVPGTAGEAETVVGHSAGSGYLNLLRRSVSARDLPGTCLTQWAAGAGASTAARTDPDGRGVPVTAQAVERVRAVFARENGLPRRKRSPVAAVYRAMCAAARQKG